MNDRRVVRGNTFAALVIPVNMQPDPMLIEKQKMDEHNRKKRVHLLQVSQLTQQRRDVEEDEKRKMEEDEE
jgi:hypothetical protein